MCIVSLETIVSLDMKNLFAFIAIVTYFAVKKGTKKFVIGIKNKEDVNLHPSVSLSM